MLTRANARAVYCLLAGSGLGLALAHGGAPHPSVAAATPPLHPAIAATQPALPVAAASLRLVQDINCLTQAVYYEARGEGERGEAAVAQVVLNRVRNPVFPKSVCAVVFQGANRSQCQFSFACNGAMRQARDDEAWDRARRIAERALDGSVMAEVGAATNFREVSMGRGWGSGFIRVTQVGQHVFYRLGRPHGGQVYPAPAQHEPAETHEAASLLPVSVASAATLETSKPTPAVSAATPSA